MRSKMIWGWIFTIIGVIMFFAPFVALFIVKQNEWVERANSDEITVGVIIGLMYAILALRGALKSVSPRVTTLITMVVFVSIFYFLDSIMNDLFWISLAVLAGYVFFWAFTAIGGRLREVAKIYADEGVKIKARKEAEESTLDSMSHSGRI